MLTVVSDIFLVLLLIASTLIMVLVFTSKKGGGMPELFGYSPLSVQSDSMDAAPAFIKKGDLIIIRRDADVNSLEIDKDVITFMAYTPQGKRFYNTHRIVGIKVKQDINYYATKGDNVNDPDLALVAPSQVLGV
ncbi:MAG TPA: signal peptidase I, partial [Clostridiales bacterium]|nr:signal peptidase I [Clostridiales bacterium]